MSEVIRSGTLNFSDIEFKAAEAILNNMTSGSFNESDAISPYLEEMTLDASYNGSCVAHPQFKKCRFDGTKFYGINGIASNIVDCYFTNAEFKDTGMASSDFSGTHFAKNTVLNNCGCTESSFINVRFSDMFAEGCVFDRSFFIHATFENTTFCHCSFEDVLFQDVSFKNCDLIHANLEYANLQNLQLEKVNFPFWGILRSFGGLQTIQGSPDSTIQYADGTRRLTASQFLTQLPELQAYFAKKNEYFILANINIFIGNQQNALYYIMSGLKYSLDQSDFRMIRYLCKLASLNHFFTSKELRQLYQLLTTNDQISSLNNHQYQLYLREIVEIRRWLLDMPFSRPQMVITCTTELDPGDYAGLAALLKFVDQMVQQELPQCAYHYSVRHNSPPSLEWFISDVLSNLYGFISVLSVSLLGLSKGAAIIQKLLDCQAKYLENKYQKKTLATKVRQEELKTDLVEEQLRQQKLMNQKLELELKQLNKDRTVLLANEEHLPKQLQEKITAIHFTIQSTDPASVPLRSYTLTPS